MRPVYKTLLKIVILLGVASYLVYALASLNHPKQELECKGLSIHINDEQHTDFINENEIRDLLVKKQLFPEGRALKDVDLAQMESVLVASPYIEEALCYTTPEGQVAIRVTPRIPIMHVINTAGEDFYIDNCGGTMPRGHHVIDLIVMTGYVQRATAGALYTPLATKLNADTYWRDQIQEVHVDAAGEITLTPHIGDHIIILGDTSNIEDKLSRMKTFQSEGLDKAGWNRYKTISVKYAGQVIATKR